MALGDALAAMPASNCLSRGLSEPYPLSSFRLFASENMKMQSPDPICRLLQEHSSTKETLLFNSPKKIPAFFLLHDSSQWLHMTTTRRRKPCVRLLSTQPIIRCLLALRHHHSHPKPPTNVDGKKKVTYGLIIAMMATTADQQPS